MMGTLTMSNSVVGFIIIVCFNLPSFYAHINSNSKYSNKCNRLFFRPFFYGFKHGMTKVTFCFLCLPLRTSQYCLCIYGEVQVQVTLFLLPQFDAQPVFITTYIKLNTFLSITTIRLCKQTFICYKIYRNQRFVE